MTATVAQIESSARLLADEVEAWLKQHTETAPASSPASIPTPAKSSGGFDIVALAAAGLAEVDRGEQASASALAEVRPSLLQRITRRDRKPADRASLHIRRAAAVMATGGWSRSALADAGGRHCILGALQSVATTGDTALRSHLHIRAAMTALPARSDRWSTRFASACRRTGADEAAARHQADIATHNDLYADSLGAVLELLADAAARAEQAGD